MIENQIGNNEILKPKMMLCSKHYSQEEKRKLQKIY